MLTNVGSDDEPLRMLLAELEPCQYGGNYDRCRPGHVASGAGLIGSTKYTERRIAAAEGNLGDRFNDDRMACGPHLVACVC